MEYSLIKTSRIVRKIDVRLMPTVALIYLLCYLDRSNIGKLFVISVEVPWQKSDAGMTGNARILNSDTGDDLMQTLRLTSHEYIIALML